MEKARRRLKWYWFLSIQPLGCVWTALNTGVLYLTGPDYGPRFLLYTLFGYIGLVVVTDMLLAQRVGRMEAYPPAYFRIFWSVVLLAELAALVVLDYLNIGGWQTFGHIDGLPRF